MKKATEVERDGIDQVSNVLTVNFSRRVSDPTFDTINSSPESDHSVIDHSIAHPASKWFAEVDDDPLESLLQEFSDLTDDEDFIDIFEAEEQHDVYIHHHQKACPTQASFDDTPKNIADNILAQMKRLKEDSKRIKYYLDELNLDKR